MSQTDLDPGDASVVTPSTADGAPDGASDGWVAARLPIALPALVAVVYGLTAWQRRWLHEDGLINLRVVENLVAGRGPVYNAGERVEAFTSPVQVAALALGRIVTFGLVPIESIVFVVGVVASATGLYLVMRGSMHLWGLGERGRIVIPFGGLIFASIPFAWDFATSGHEGSMGFLWIGLCTFGLARRVRERHVDLRPPVAKPRWLLVVIGSGALIRPEFALYTASFVVVWFVVHRTSAGSKGRALAWMVGPTVAYQVFRMGYYGLVLPNTALAKLGGPLGASEGLYYVGAFVSPLRLWLPLMAVVVVLVLLLRTARPDQLALTAALMVPALLNIAYLVSIGGDYVNGRLLVVPLLALLAPVGVVDPKLFATASGHARPVMIGLGVVVLLWASAAASTMRAPWKVSSNNFLDAKFDAREVAVRRWTRTAPRHIDDYQRSFLAGPYKTLVSQYDAADSDLLVLDDPFNGQTIVLETGEGPAIASTTIGALGVVSGIDVRIIDRLALADPVASHLPVTGNTAGHLRKLSNPWVYGRAGIDADPASAAAIEALGCGELGQLMDDTTGSMSPARFVTNFFHSPANTRLSIPADPVDAVDEFC